MFRHAPHLPSVCALYESASVTFFGSVLFSAAHLHELSFFLSAVGMLFSGIAAYRNRGTRRPRSRRIRGKANSRMDFRPTPKNQP